MDSSTAMKRTTNSSSRPIPASKPVKPLQTHASSNGAKDAKMAAMLTSLRAEIDQLKKLQAAKPIENKLEEIAQPSKIMNLQHAMGLADNKSCILIAEDDRENRTFGDIKSLLNLILNQLCVKDEFGFPGKFNRSKIKKFTSTYTTQQTNDLDQF
ncbi:hypothetical protein BYT27DRAFT_7212929 [Phlegmacium glaucopus]|nr:hypothetical protein BYT27DRAFT_7212929 [Phlegmacium glaucopus]